MKRTPFTAFGVRVNAEVGAQALTFRELAAAVQTSPAYLWKVLHGQHDSKSLESRISAYFGWKEVKA